MKSKYFKDQQKIEEIIRKCDVCHLAMVDHENKPYAITMNFGYRNGEIFLHSAPHGKKIKVLENNKNVLAIFSTNHELYIQSEQVACSYGMRYKSVHAYGKIEFIEDYDQKVEALNVIMKHWTERKFTYSRPAVVNVKVFKLVVSEMTGKEFGHLKRFSANE